jgi:hypothetical protein
MKSVRKSPVLCFSAFLFLCLLPTLANAQNAAAGSILPAPEAAKLLPDQVYYAGQSASTQLRNATGLRFADGLHTLAVLVDTSGYSTAVQQKYQGYLLTEAGLDIEGHHLAAGAYGFGFVKNQFLVMDIGNHDLFAVDTTHEAGLHGPRPLQTLDAGSPGTWKLCSGRDCVDFSRAK